MHASLKRNFQVMNGAQWLEPLCRHIPDRYEHWVRYVGWYCNRARGEWAKKASPHAGAALTCGLSEESVSGFAARFRELACLREPAADLSSVPDSPERGEHRVRFKLMWSYSKLEAPKPCGRSEEMAAPLLSDEELVRRLGTHPQLRTRMESLLLAVEDEAGDLREADRAELRLIDEIRRMGQEALQAWASGQVEKTSREIVQEGGVWSEGKKNCTGIPRLATLP